MHYDNLLTRREIERERHLKYNVQKIVKSKIVYAIEIRKCIEFMTSLNIFRRVCIRAYESQSTFTEISFSRESKNWTEIHHLKAFCIVLMPKPRVSATLLLL